MNMNMNMHMITNLIINIIQTILIILIMIMQEKQINQSVDWPNCKCHKASHATRETKDLSL